MRAPLVITSDLHPFEVGCFACAVCVGVWGLLVPDGISNAIADAFYPWSVKAYYGFMGAWGLAALLCVLLVGDQDLRLRFVRCCLYGVGWGALCYVAAALYANGLNAGTAAMPWFWVSVVCTWRIVQIGRDRARLAEARAQNWPADPSPLGCPDTRPAPRRNREGGG